MTSSLQVFRFFSPTRLSSHETSCVFTLMISVSSRAFLKPEGVVSLVRAVLRTLHVPQLKSGTWGLSKTLHLVPQELIMSWSGHSLRHVLPSLAAAVGVPQAKIGFLDRWPRLLMSRRVGK